MTTRAEARRAAAAAIAEKTREEGGSPRETAEVVSTPATAVPPSSLPHLRAPDGTHTPRHTFRAPQELWDAFQLKARENGVNGSEVLRRTMEEYVS